MTQSWKGNARKGAVLAGAIALLTAVAVQAASAETPDTTAAADSECTTPSTATPVEPLETTPIGQNAVIALAPSEDQKWVAPHEDDWEMAWWLLAGEYEHGGIDLDDERLSFGVRLVWHTPEQVDPNIVFTGAWKIDCGPSKIEIDVDGQVHEAELLELEDRPGWGTYHYDPEMVGAPPVKVTAYDQDGEVFDEVDFSEEEALAELNNVTEADRQAGAALIEVDH